MKDTQPYIQNLKPVFSIDLYKPLLHNKHVNYDEEQPTDRTIDQKFLHNITGEENEESPQKIKIVKRILGKNKQNPEKLKLKILGRRSSGKARNC